ncbi:MAG: leucyl/phenylalanyl-tRNA--protein transferase [Planctomycetota bacterium]
MRVVPPSPSLDPELLVAAYSRGLFPMAESRGDTHVHWLCPDPRAILPIAEEDPAGAFRVRRSLRKALRDEPFVLTYDRAFARVVSSCAAPGPGREQTWISRPIEAAFVQLHGHDLAHSIEAWAPPRKPPPFSPPFSPPEQPPEQPPPAETFSEESKTASPAFSRADVSEPDLRPPKIDGLELVGGIYGLALGRAFFAESMFSTRPYASQACLVELVRWLRGRGARLLDVQFHNDHLAQFGVAEVARDDYLRRLGKALGPGWSD